MDIIIEDIINQIPHINFIGDSKAIISNVKNIDDIDFDDNSLGWYSNKNSISDVNFKKGTIILGNENFKNLTNIANNVNLIIVENPRKYFSQVLSSFFDEKSKMGFIASSSFIAPGIKFDFTSVNIGHNVIIESGVEIGKNVIIGHNTVIKRNTMIHDNVTIGSNCTIGGIGFGYEQDDNGNYIQIPHIGNVVIENYAEIGNNVCIDRGVIGATLIKKNTKIDNLVHIAHGVVIGENSLVIANAMIAGSVIIGKNCWISPSASIIQKKTIGDNSMVGLGAVVLKDVPENTIVVGNPAKKLERD